MFANWSLSRKLITVGIATGIFVPILGLFTYLSARKVTQLNTQISDVKLAKTKSLGELVFKFRDIRIQIRTVPIRGMTPEMIDKYVDLTIKAVEGFVDAQKTYAQQIENDRERQLFNDFKTQVDDFLAFGTHLVTLAKTHKPEDIDEVARLVRDVCPVKAAEVERAVNRLIEQQTTEAHELVAQTRSAERQMVIGILLGSLIGFTIAVSLGTLIARKISRDLQALATSLEQSAGTVTDASTQVSKYGSSLSSASSEQAAALQETVSAIEEINSMVLKNSENASRSKETASESLLIAQQGKELVDQMVNEVTEIQRSMGALTDSVEAGNQELNQIVKLFSEIEQKTKVIHDIVFQTKLLSFNASVEAARAGESGKGFAVVAEEVGNLAAMSGKSAKEIGDLLSTSVNKVEEIIRNSRERMERQAAESRMRIEKGLHLGQKCGVSLTDILSGAQTVERMVNEIAVASKEQSTGVAEVTKAMHQMDQVTQENANISSASSQSAAKLQDEAVEMKHLVEKLLEIVEGSQQMGTHPAAFAKVDSAAFLEDRKVA